MNKYRQSLKFIFYIIFFWLDGSKVASNDTLTVSPTGELGGYMKNVPVAKRGVIHVWYVVCWGARVCSFKIASVFTWLVPGLGGGQQTEQLLRQRRERDVVGRAAELLAGVSPGTGRQSSVINHWESESGRDTQITTRLIFSCEQQLEHLQ